MSGGKIWRKKDVLFRKILENPATIQKFDFINIHQILPAAIASYQIDLGYLHHLTFCYKCSPKLFTNMVDKKQVPTSFALGRT